MSGQKMDQAGFVQSGLKESETQRGEYPFGTPNLKDVNVGLRFEKSGERRFVPGEVHLLTIKHHQSALTQPAIRFNFVGVERVRQME